MGLEAADWTVVAKNTLVLARVDHEEPYWAEKAGQQLTAGGITVEITPRLQEAMAEKWTWADYPMPWCTRSEVREVSNEPQKIRDDIRHGQLLIHAHAEELATPSLRSAPTSAAARASTSTARTTCGRSPTSSTRPPKPWSPSSESTEPPCSPARRR
ncbi:hypothetical protein [Streptomyces diastatochromogenes]|uniref:hypothetical protein n=1 Tax=Streptomyces diastatochromogenes TaxID=42236 RepID=UPI00269D6C3B